MVNERLTHNILTFMARNKILFDNFTNGIIKLSRRK